MAIRFTADIENLIAHILSGGFVVQAIEAVPDSRGRTTDIHLKNEVVLCWDSYSRVVWAEGAPIHTNVVEWYLRKIYEGPKFLRLFATWRTRWVLRIKSTSQAAALWLLRSESPTARILRQLIEHGPAFPHKQRHFQYRYGPSSNLQDLLSQSQNRMHKIRIY